MKLFGTNLQPIKADLKQSSFPMRSEDLCKSKIQYSCGCLLRTRFPFDAILEEWFVPEEHLYIDFFLPNRKLAIEVDGGQHDKYTPFFHGSPQGFAAAQARDSAKNYFCKINNITLIRVKSLEELEACLNQ